MKKILVIAILAGSVAWTTSVQAQNSANEDTFRTPAFNGTGASPVTGSRAPNAATNAGVSVGTTLGADLTAAAAPATATGTRGAGTAVAPGAPASAAAAVPAAPGTAVMPGTTPAG